MPGANLSDTEKLRKLDEVILALKNRLAEPASLSDQVIYFEIALAGTKHWRNMLLTYPSSHFTGGQYSIDETKLTQLEGLANYIIGSGVHPPPSELVRLTILEAFSGAPMISSLPLLKVCEHLDDEYSAMTDIGNRREELRNAADDLSENISKFNKSLQTGQNLSLATKLIQSHLSRGRFATIMAVTLAVAMSVVVGVALPFLGKSSQSASSPTEAYTRYLEHAPFILVIVFVTSLLARYLKHYVLLATTARHTCDTLKSIVASKEEISDEIFRTLIQSSLTSLVTNNVSSTISDAADPLDMVSKVLSTGKG